MGWKKRRKLNVPECNLDKKQKLDDTKSAEEMEEKLEEIPDVYICRPCCIRIKHRSITASQFIEFYNSSTVDYTETINSVLNGKSVSQDDEPVQVDPLTGEFQSVPLKSCYFCGGLFQQNSVNIIVDSILGNYYKVLNLINSTITI